METRGEVIIRCAHGDEVSYPVAEVEITVGDRVMQVEAGVSCTLTVSVLLGTDVPQLFGMLPNTGIEESGAGESAVSKALAVTTRANARRQEELSAVQERNEETSGIQPRALDDKVVKSQPDSQER